jgi:GNAT superfamily N-acetyltransferase
MRTIAPEEGQDGSVETTVHPELRGRGVGTALLRAVLPVLRERGRTTIEGWWIAADGVGEGWARSWGFRRTHPPNRGGAGWTGRRAARRRGAHRCHGLGLDIEIARVTTSTGAENTHMIRVNTALGFGVTCTTVVLTGEVDALSRRLGEPVADQPTASASSS